MKCDAISLVASNSLLIFSFLRILFTGYSKSGGKKITKYTAYCESFILSFLQKR